MRPHSALARLQQFTTVGLLLAATAWLFWFWRESLAWSITGFVLIVFGYSLFLAVEFALLRLIGRTDPAPLPTWRELAHAWWSETLAAPRVFCWRQPFRWREVPDRLDVSPGRRGVVFIHGFVCNRGFWTPWLKRLRAEGHPFVAVNLEPVFGTIDDYVSIIEDAVVRTTQASGLPPLMVCHSMGGLAARAWLRGCGGEGRIHHLVTIGTPHRGTWLGRFSHLANGRQMRLDSEWLRELALHDPRCKITCWYSNCDNIVFPASTATLPAADNRLVRGVAHVQMAFQPQLVSQTLELLKPES